jgi:poly-gamma-glutamate synthesis protein (capsule biosynthesis protein)
LTLERYPADAYEEWNLDANALPADLVNARPAGGFGISSLWNDGVLYEFTLDDGRLTGLKLHPITQGRDKPLWQRGIPMIASGDDATRILTRHKEMSEPFGTEMELKNDVGIVNLPT